MGIYDSRILDFVKVYTFYWIIIILIFQGENEV